LGLKIGDGSFFSPPTVQANPNPAWFIPEHWPWSINQYRWILVFEWPLLFPVKIAFITEWMCINCMLKFKPIDWNFINPSIIHWNSPTLQAQVFVLALMTNYIQDKYSEHTYA
jgi:hypothetical protein